MFEGIRQQSYEAILAHGEAMPFRLRDQLSEIINELGIILAADV